MFSSASSLLNRNRHLLFFSKLALVLVPLSVFTARPHGQGAGLDVAFVMDGSGSISAADFALQKQGLIAAVQNPQLVPLNNTIGLTIVQFAGACLLYTSPSPRDS